jgi:hypothetical protein
MENRVQKAIENVQAHHLMRMKAVDWTLKLMCLLAVLTFGAD